MTAVGERAGLGGIAVATAGSIGTVAEGIKCTFNTIASALAGARGDAIVGGVGCAVEGAANLVLSKIPGGKRLLGKGGKGPSSNPKGSSSGIDNRGHNGPPRPSDETVLFRRGESDTRVGLKQQSEKAEAHPNFGVHGVSASASSKGRYPGQTVRCATCKEIEDAGFKVIKTGGPRHYTIELPKPITREVTNKFNELFR